MARSKERAIPFLFDESEPRPPVNHGNVIWRWFRDIDKPPKYRAYVDSRPFSGWCG
jgi:hypothetical protein